MIKTLNWFLVKFIQILGNLQVAVVLLLLIALNSGLGTLIEQDKPLNFYQVAYSSSKPMFGFLTSDLIIGLGLDHIYTVWWFVLLILLFGSSLISCTFSRQIPSLKLARIWRYYNNIRTFENMELSSSIKDGSLSYASFLLKRNSYKVLHQGPFIYAYRGLIGKIGPIVVHLSIIIILLGSLIGVISGYVIQEIVPRGNLFHLQNSISSGILSYIPQNVEGYVKDFKITYTEEGSIDQFYSDLSVLDNEGNEKFNKTIYVNEPLRFNGISFYQTDWGIVSAKLSLDEKEAQISLKLINEGSSRFWVGSINTEKNFENLIIVFQDLTGKFQLYSSKQELLSENEIGDKFFINGRTFRVKNLVTSTGLQIKSDPGINFVYFGFMLLIFSVALSYISYDQLWAFKTGSDLYISGQTNRATYSFQRQFLSIVEELSL